MSDLPIKYRAAKEEDKKLIYSSWILSYGNSPFAKGFLYPDYCVAQAARIDTLLEQCPVIVACNEDDEDIIYGYICSTTTAEEISLVHWLYVKDLYRMNGVARGLFNQIKPTTPTVCSHPNLTFQRLRRKFNLIKIGQYGDLLAMNPDDPTQAYLTLKEKRTK